MGGYHHLRNPHVGYHIPVMAEMVEYYIMVLSEFLNTYNNLSALRIRVGAKIPA